MTLLQDTVNLPPTKQKTTHQSFTFIGIIIKMIKKKCACYEIVRLSSLYLDKGRTLHVCHVHGLSSQCMQSLSITKGAKNSVSADCWLDNQLID